MNKPKLILILILCFGFSNLAFASLHCPKETYDIRICLKTFETQGPPLIQCYLDPCILKLYRSELSKHCEEILPQTSNKLLTSALLKEKNHLPQSCQLELKKLEYRFTKD